MIEWKQYIATNAPEYNVDYLVYELGAFTSAKLIKNKKGLFWVDYYGNVWKHVSHYSEVNYPSE